MGMTASVKSKSRSPFQIGHKESQLHVVITQVLHDSIKEYVNRKSLCHHLRNPNQGQMEKAPQRDPECIGNHIV